jgi:hypothetical protein
MIRLLTDAGKSIPVKADEPAYRMSLSTNEEPDTPWSAIPMARWSRRPRPLRSMPAPASAGRSR